MYMKDFCIFYEEHTKEEDSHDGVDAETGGISVSKLLSSIYPTESFTRFNDLSVPFGIQRFSFPEEREQGTKEEDDECPCVEESAFSKMFYSVAKDLGSGSKKNGQSRRTKKKRS